MKIYLAGKMYYSECCWRNHIVKNYHDLCTDIYEACDRLVGNCEFPTAKNAILGKYDYIGPYFISDVSHGMPGVNTHGFHELSDLPYTVTDEEKPSVRQSVYNCCLQAVAQSDIFFAWITDISAYGTFYEISFAQSLNKPTILFFSRNVNSQDFWFYQTHPGCFSYDELQEDDPKGMPTLLEHALSCFAMKGKSQVYFILADGLNKIKIGTSNDPEKRKSALSTGSAVPLKILKTIPGDYTTEQQLHDRFSHIRVDKEWFFATQELTDHIESL